MNGPMGMWSATVDLPHGTATVELGFFGDGTAAVWTGTGTASGTGTWTSTGAGRFAYRLVEPLPGGCVVVNQSGRHAEDGFSSSGTTQVFDHSGHLERWSATRVDAVPLRTRPGAGVRSTA